MSKSNNYAYSSNYQKSKSALQRQTQKLLAERQQIYGVNPSYQPTRQPVQHHYLESTSLTPIVHHEARKQHKTQQVVGKLQEIIKLCKQQGALSHEQMQEVVKVESEVLNYLKRTTDEAMPQIVRPVSSSEQVIKSRQQIPPPSFQTSSNAQHTWGKVQANRQVLSDDTLEIINQIERKALTEIIHLQQERDAFRRQKQLLNAQLERIRREFVKFSAGDVNIQSTFGGNSNNAELQRVKQENHTLKMHIAEVQRSSQEQRTGSFPDNQETVRLRSQNSILRAENHYLKATLEKVNITHMQNRQTIKFDQRSTQQNRPNSSNLIQGQFSSQIEVYQNELKRASVVINELRSRLANVPGLEELHDQGERIRRQTTELLRLKSQIGNHMQDNQMIQQLQQRLDNEERNKVIFLEELKAFKQRYVELEEENKILRKSKVSFDPVARPIDVSQRRQSTSPRAGIMKKQRGGFLGDYESTLQQMKQVLY